MLQKYKRNFLLQIILVLCALTIQNAVFSQEKIEILLEKARKTYNANPDSSIFYCNEAEKLNNSQFDGEILVCKARYLLLKSDYEQCELSLSKAILIFKKTHKLNQLSSAYSLKSLLSERIGDQENELSYLKIAYEIDKKSGNKLGLTNKLFNLIYLTIKGNKLSEAKKYLDEVEQLQSYFDEESFYYYHQNSGKYFFGLGQFTESLNEFYKAKNIADKLKMIDSQATINTLLAHSFFKLNDLKNAKISALQSLEISKQNKLIFEEQEALEITIKIFQQLNDYKTAFEFQKSYIQVSNQILNIEKLNKIKSINDKIKRIENEKILEKKNLKIKQQRKLNATIRSKSNILSLFLIFSVLSVVVVSFVLFRTFKLNKIIKKQKQIVETKNHEILDSISYAKRIQSAILPQEKTIKHYFPNSFIIYKPKDIVAGDFYWFEVIDNLIFFAAADCTGHGVPGAMVSVVCHNALNRSVKEFNLKLPNQILDKTREIVISEFEKSDEDVKDGMDISLCVFNLKEQKLCWSGAHNPLWILRNKEIIEYKADKQPIGKFAHAKPFSLHEIEIQQNDEIYFFTDGFQDQFGGEKGKKFKASKMKEILLSNEEKSVFDKENILHLTFNNWKGDLEQIDDVCFIGLKI